MCETETLKNGLMNVLITFFVCFVTMFLMMLGNDDTDLPRTGPWSPGPHDEYCDSQ